MSLPFETQKIGGIANPRFGGVPATATVEWQERVVDVRVAKPQWWTVIVGAPRQGTYYNPFPPGSGLPTQTEQNPDPCSTFLRVVFGTGQITQTFDIDVGMGGTFPVFGSQVQIDVLSGPPFTWGGAVTQSPGAIPVSISPGFNSRTLPAIRTVNIGTVLALATAFATCPPFAVRVEHAQSATATLSRTIAFHRRNNAGVITQYTYLVSANRFAPPFPEWTAALPIPFDCSRVSYLNNDAAAPASVRFLFELGI